MTVAAPWDTADSTIDRSIPEFIPFTDGYPDGPARLVLIGPPGTGKTSTILNALAIPFIRSHLHGDGHPDPAGMLLCSFSNAAANEIRERLATSCDQPAMFFRRAASTIHSEALRILQDQRGPQQLFDPFTKDARRFGAADHGMNDPLSASDVVPEQHETRHAMLTVWDMARALRLTEDMDWLRWKCGAVKGKYKSLQSLDHDDVLEQVMADVAEYGREKQDAHAIDFMDMLERALLCTAPERELLVLDEAQDCTPIQWELFHHWAAQSKYSVACGDDDQRVHEWMGAVSTFIREVSLGEHEGWEVRRLARSFRVPAAQHRLARSIVTMIVDRPDAEYEPKPEPGSIVMASTADVLDALLTLPDGHRAFVLTRTNAQCLTWGKLMTEHGIGAVGRGCPLSATAQAAVFRALTALCNGAETDAYAVRALATRIPAALYGQHGGKSKCEEELALVGDDGPAALATLKAWIGERLEPWLAGGVVQAANSLQRMGREYIEAFGRITAAGGSLDPDAAWVEVMTMHASKGREAELVIIDRDMPRAVQYTYGLGTYTDPDPAGMDAERRLLYVAVTRSKDRTMLADGPRGNARTVYMELVA